jgi:pimeloyl-ACP methyl ester carboxylesterase
MGTMKTNFMGYRYVDRDVYRHLLEVPLMAYSLFPGKETEMKPAANDPHPPIIFVHGVGGNRAHFLPMTWYLWMHGRKSSYRIDLSGEISVRRMAWRLARYIKKVQRVTGKSRVEIVGHSLGGIVARLAIQNYGLDEAVKTLITLGTPHKGTYSARFADSRLTNALLPTSPLIQELARAGWPKGVRGISVWSENDIFVLPAESGQIEGTESIEMSPFTHFSYLCHPKSWELVKRCLDPGLEVKLQNS